MEDIAKEYITYARQFANNGCFSKAFDLYITAFEKCTRLKHCHEQEFRNVANRLNEVLAQTDRMKDVLTNFGRALTIYPTNIHLLNDIGKYLYKFGFYSEAWIHFQQAIRLDSGFVNAEKNLNSVKYILMERWRYRMLNDKTRNLAYKEAITETIKPYLDTVVDLGAGTCLLSLFAYKHNPVTVIAVEPSQVMTQLSECITQDMGIIDIIIVNDVPTKMNYLDVGGKRSLLITEMFDVGLFGKQILQALVHAWEHMITSDGRVLPKRAEFFLVGANCDRLHHKYQLSIDAKTMLNIPNMYVHIITHDETYDCEDVNHYKDLEFMTEYQTVLKIDFNSHDDLNDKLSSTTPYQVSLTAKKSGTVNIYIGWFNLYLTDKISITTNPQSSKKAFAWQQAVFYDTTSQHVKANYTMNVDVSLDGGKFSIASDPTVNIVRIAPQTLRFLNDAELIKAIDRCIAMVCVYLGQIEDISQINLVDLCPFPWFGLLMLKRGAQSLICYAKTPHDKRFFKEILKVHDIPVSTTKILVGEDWTTEVFGLEKYHAIFGNILDQCGDVDIHQRELSLHLKEAHLHQNGLFLPNDVKIMAQVVSSKWLDINNQVYNENTCGYELENHVNRFQVSQNFFIDFTNLEYTPLTDPVMMGSLINQTGLESVAAPVTQAGEANAILCWYQIDLMQELNEITTKRSNCFTDGTAFLITKIELTTDNQINMTRASDADGSYRISFEIQTT